MSYIKENLMPNENVIFVAKINPAIFVPTIIALSGSCIFAGGAFLFSDTIRIFNFFISGLFGLITLRVFIEVAILFLTTEFAITNQRIIAKTGFIHRRTLEMLLSKVESVAIYQNIVGRLFNFGNVTVTGTGGTRERFRAISDPIVVRSRINQIIERVLLK